MSDIRRNLDNEFAYRRDRALWEAERRKQEVISKIPEIGSIEAEITLTGLRFARGIISEDLPSMDSEALTERLNQLKRRKEELLLSANYPADYLEPRFSCGICEDRGYVADESGNYVPCSCYRKLYLQRLYEFSNILDDGNTGFKFFNEEYFSDKPSRQKYKSEISPRENILAIRDHCLKFIDNFSDKNTRNMYFFGPTGTGKTFLAKSCGLELIKKGYSVLYLSAPTLFSIIHRYRISNPSEDTEAEQAYRNLITTNLLILDDLGTEPRSDARYAELLSLIELRKNRDNTTATKTIISSNLDLKHLFQEYNERIASRIVGEFDTFRFFGDDIRIVKKIGKMSP